MKNNFLLPGAFKLCLLAFLIFLSLGSCSTGDSGFSPRMLGGSSQAITFLSCRAVSEKEIEFVFSKPVIVKQITFEPELSVVSIENGSTVRINLEENPGPGKLIKADLLAEDEKKNSINVLVSFRSRNNNMPSLVINELCTEYSNPKTEYIEFKMKSDGNLGAMRVFVIGNSNAARQTVFEFSPVNVKSGEYVVLHLRNIEESSKDEYGVNLAESGGRNASPAARDFWFPGNTKRLHKTSIVYVLDQDDTVLCAVLINENPGAPWPKDYFTETANLLTEKGVWHGEAVSSAGTTNTRTICRDETVPNSKSAADWYITATSSATPGSLNNPKRYLN